MSHKNLAIPSLLIAFGFAPSVAAQGVMPRAFAMPDSAQMTAVMGRAMRRLQPAQFVLDHRAELMLTPEQLPFVESLVLAQVDSTRVRTERRFAMARAATHDSLAARAGSMMTWTGTIDEAAIRESARRAADQSAEYQVDIARDRHAVGAVLTSSQLSMLDRIEASDMMSGMPVRAASVGLSPAAASDHPYFEYQVDRKVAQQPGTSGPKYPDAMRASGPSGEVLAQFIVDTDGHYVGGTFMALKTSNALFTAAVRDALPQMRFVPAEKGGTNVPQLVQQSFTFTPGMK